MKVFKFSKLSTEKILASKPQTTNNEKNTVFTYDTLDREKNKVGICKLTQGDDAWSSAQRYCDPIGNISNINKQRVPSRELTTNCFKF